ncbi:Diphthamide biosynthesis protein 4 [Termitomyces sp. J132]|nr:Diphthamide biosynthesis protein 4 [Termitomyces sp. J132]
MAPRPAQVVSLEEFEEAMTESEKDSVWRYQCRCGGMYRITAADMENGHHLVGCSSCSEVVWVGYELQESDNEGVFRYSIIDQRLCSLNNIQDEKYVFKHW